MLEYSNNYSKKKKSAKDESAVDNTGAFVDFTNDNTTDFSKFEGKITTRTGSNGKKVLKYLCHRNI